jgi:hypothetical protein
LGLGARRLRGFQLRSSIRTRHFGLLIRSLSIEAIRSVTHLILARFASRWSLSIHLRTEKGGRKAAPLPALFLGTSRIALRPQLCQGPLPSSGTPADRHSNLGRKAWKPPAHTRSFPGRPTRYHEYRKHSVPVRVHSVSKELWFRRTTARAAALASNVALTHGTVESPSKLPQPSVNWENGRVQSVPRA